jgi:hypothetical protein
MGSKPRLAVEQMTSPALWKQLHGSIMVLKQMMANRDPLESRLARLEMIAAIVLELETREEQLAWDFSEHSQMQSER